MRVWVSPRQNSVVHGHKKQKGPNLAVSGQIRA